MASLLSNRLVTRALRPAFTLVEQRMERVTHAFQKDLDALHHEVADLRRQSYGLGLLLGEPGRDGHRMPTAPQVDRLVGEVCAVTGAPAERVRGEVAVAYRHVVALEALGVGAVGGALSDVCGRLAAVPLLAARGGGNVLEVLEVGAGHGLFAAGLRRMLGRGGAEARLTLVDAADGTPPREEVVRANLALGGADGAVRLVRGALADAEVRARLADRRYGVVLLSDARDADAVRDLAAPGALLVVPAAAADPTAAPSASGGGAGLPGHRAATGGLRAQDPVRAAGTTLLEDRPPSGGGRAGAPVRGTYLGRVADSVYFRAG
ncbi:MULTISPECIES: class I SAM-dependent methyltransferase [unclassified Streptomyces]|uniref:class I SAM-dependent methyltransferase n=1 Tax=unclassified Streptomyces TaxID=2593676 RepID=UPI000B15B7EF|nr:MULTISPECIES: class I SAM-dependent methyltransferase [unclassified Streptomyces]